MDGQDLTGFFGKDFWMNMLWFGIAIFVFALITFACLGCASLRREPYQRDRGAEKEARMAFMRVLLEKVDQRSGKQQSADEESVDGGSGPMGLLYEGVECTGCGSSRTQISG